MCASADLFTAFSSEVGATVIDDAGVDLAGMGRSTRPAIWRYIVNSFVGRAKMRQDAESSSNPSVKIMQLHMTLTAPDRNAAVMRLRSCSGVLVPLARGDDRLDEGEDVGRRGP